MLKGYVLTLEGEPKPEDVHRMTNELNNSSDRSLALVGSSLVDDILRRKLEAFLHQDNKAATNLFRVSGALGSFSSRIDLGRLIGAYGDDAKKEMHTLRKIRNDFAHKFDKHEFREQPNAERAYSLIFCERYTWSIDSKVPGRGFSFEGRDEALKNPRDRFLLSVCALLWCFSTMKPRQMPDPKW